MKLFELFGLEWSHLTPVTRLVLIFQFVAFSLSVARLVTWLVRMYRKGPASMKGTGNVDIDKRAAVAAALNGTDWLRSVNRGQGQTPGGDISIAQAQRDVRRAFDACHIDIESAGRYCVLILLLSVVNVTFAVYPMLDRQLTQSGRLTSIGGLLIGQQLLGFLSFGGTLSAGLYALLGTTTRVLRKRESRWRHLIGD